MYALADTLRAEHRNFIHVLQLMYAHTKLGEVNDPASCRFMLNAVLYMQEFGDGVHHEKDSILLGRIQALDPSTWGLCLRLRNLRNWLRESEVEMQRCIASAGTGDGDLNGTVKSQVEEYCSSYSAYIGLDEQEALPAALDCLTETDWRAICKLFNQPVDPVFGLEAQRRYRTPYDGIMAYNDGMALQSGRYKADVH